MTNPNDQELERRFASAEVPRRLLYPVRYRLLRGIGVPIRPPVTYGYLGHLLDAAGHIVVYMAIGGSILHYVDGTPVRLLLMLTVIMVLFVSASNWLRFRAIRRRIGLS
ncbi:MAG: hypothetical protein RIB46_20165 [Pseudomonadales bacterium]